MPNETIRAPLPDEKFDKKALEKADKAKVEAEKDKSKEE